MADDHQHHLYDYDKKINDSNLNTCSSSSLVHNNNTHPPSSSDEISLFLHQLMHRSSSTAVEAAATTTSVPPASFMSHGRGPHGQWFPSRPENSHPLFKPQGISAADSLINLSSGAYLSGNVRVSGGGNNLSSSSLGVSENDTTDDNDCESEEGVEAFVEEGPPKPAPRNSSKRSRAAEVHNLSEKRRRSRINEKMKALQNLIPNSNKTDKASMLDEAIEYLKQLQLQVQMLTMRNGLSLHPMCLPGVLQPVQFSSARAGYGEENGTLHLNSAGTVSMNQENPSPNMFSVPNQCSPSNQLRVPNMPNIVNSDTSYGLDSSIRSHFAPFQLRTSSEEETCREDVLTHQQLQVNHSQTNPTDFDIGATSTALLPFDTQASITKDHHGSFEGVAEGVHLKNIMQRDLILSPRSDGVQTGRSIDREEAKLGRKDF